MINIFMSLPIYMPIIIVIASLLNVKFEIINIILFFNLILLYINAKKSKNIWILFYISIGLIMPQIFFSKVNINISYLIYFINFTMMSIYFTDKTNLDKISLLINKNINKLFYINLIIVILMIISFISGFGWMEVWGKKQFVFTMGFPHDACYFFASIQCVFIVLYYNLNTLWKKSICKYINILLCIFSLLTNARTPFLISIFVMMIFLYSISRNRVAFWGISVWLSIIAICVNILGDIVSIDQIPIINKFIRGINMGNISSSRDLIWENIIMHYEGVYGIKEKLIGGGMGISNYFNLKKLNLDLWSHNDFIEILISLGLSGILVYIYSYYRISKATKSIMFTVILIVVAYWNGLYVYPTIMFFMPYLILSIMKIKDMSFKEMK